jgi:hypothetical protein
MIERDGDVFSDVGPEVRIEDGDELIIAETDEGSSGSPNSTPERETKHACYYENERHVTYSDGGTGRHRGGA